MKYLIRLFLLSLLVAPGLAHGQKIYQLSGLVISEEGQESIPYVTIQVNGTRRGALTNNEGFYSIPVAAYDTIFFTHMGYQPTMFVVADYLREYPRENSTYIYAIHYMMEDTLTLPDVVIFPYDTPEELKMAVLNMTPQGSPEALARANLSPDIIDAIIQTMPTDADERMIVGRQMYYDYYQNRNLIRTAAIDPIAAMQLLQYVAEKARRKKDKDLNYWEN